MALKIFYNDSDVKCCAWITELIKVGHLPEGEIDERPIEKLDGRKLRGFTQCHFFAGIGGWPLAFKLAGLDGDFQADTGSCPCQPFSIAGKRKGAKDKRHVWPAFRRVLSERRPAVCFGEQVASADGRVWLSGIRVDLEGMGYAVGAADLCAAGISAPMVSQRLHWVAEAEYNGRNSAKGNAAKPGSNGKNDRLFERNGSKDSRLAKADRKQAHIECRRSGESGEQQGRALDSRRETTRQAAGKNRHDHDSRLCAGSRLGPANGFDESSQRGIRERPAAEREGNYSRLAEAYSIRKQARLSGPFAREEGNSGIFDDGIEEAGYHEHWWSGPLQVGRNAIEATIERGGGKFRAQWRIKPGLSLLADGIPGRVDLLRGFGNAIVPQLAAEFIQAWIESHPCSSVSIRG